MAFDPASATYYWVASFSGDSHTNSFTSGCNDEPVAVGTDQAAHYLRRGPARVEMTGATIATAVAALRWQAEELWP
jgi:hypothetical protein